MKFSSETRGATAHKGKGKEPLTTKEEWRRGGSLLPWQKEEKKGRGKNAAGVGERGQK